MRELIFVLIALSLPTLALADGYSYYPQDYTLIPPSPEVGSLLKYNEIEVDNFTGIPNISFELFRLNCGRITIPFTLSYHGGGIRNDDKEGNAGLGWNVLASACISREVQGAPDESTSHIKGLFHLDSNSQEFRQRLIAKNADYDPFDGVAFNNSRSWISLLGHDYYYGKADMANDIFRVTGIGLNGTFAFDDRKEIIMSSASPFTIEPENFSLTAFNVTDQNGLKYTFAEQETSKYEYFYGDPELDRQSDSISYTSTWHLSELKDLSGNKVTYTYHQSNGYEMQYSAQEYEWRYTNIRLDTGVPIRSSSVSSVKYFPKLLKEIKGAGVSIVFEYNTLAERYSHRYIISKITVRAEGEDGPVKVFNFTYKEQPSTMNNEPWYQLDQVTENGQLLYSFNYVEDDTYENRFQALDFGGYFNASDEGLIPTVGIGLGRGANRSVNPEVSKIGSLSEIYYPTGGHTAIEWESNDFGYVDTAPLSQTINTTKQKKVKCDTLRMCMDSQYRRLKIYNYRVGSSSNVYLDASQYYAFNPAILFGSDYENEHPAEYCGDTYQFPHVTITNNANSNDKKIVFLDKKTIEQDYKGQPIPLLLSEGIYTVELKYPTSIRGMQENIEESIEKYMASAYSDAGFLFLRKETTDPSSPQSHFQGKDYWCGLRVKRIESYSDNDELPLVKNYYYAYGMDPTMSNGVVQRLPHYLHTSFMVIPGGGINGYDYTSLQWVGEQGFPRTPFGAMNQVQYPIVTTKLSKGIGQYGEPIPYSLIEKYYYSSSANAGSLYYDYNYSDFLGCQPVGGRMYTSRAHWRGNLFRKSIGQTNVVETQYTYNIYEPSDLSVLTTEPFTVCDFTKYVSGNGGYGGFDYGIGKYSIIPYTKTIASEVTTDHGFEYEKHYDYFYTGYTPKNDYGLVKSVSTVNSEQQQELTQFTYMHNGKNYTPLVETQVTTIDGIVTDAQRNEYDAQTHLLKAKYSLSSTDVSANSLLSSSQSTTDFQKEMISKLEYTYKYNEKGNIVEIAYRGEPLVSYLWGYYGQYPIIEAKGVDYLKLLTAATQQGFDQEKVLKGKVCTDTQVRQLSELIRRSLPTGTEISSIAYRPLVGIMESTDARGVITTFDYDALGRLKSVADMNKSIISRFDYHQKSDKTIIEED